MTRLRTAIRWLLPVAILGSAVAIVALLVMTRPDIPAEPAEERAWPVTTVAVDVSVHRPVLRLQGFVESPSTATLRAAVNADVTAVPAREGDGVGAGDALVELDEEELRLALEEREADVAELRAQRRIEEQRVDVDGEELALEEELLRLFEREVQRLEGLSRDQFVSPSALERAQQERTRQRLAVAARRFAVETAEQRLEQFDARLERARTLRDRAALDLDRAQLRAPYNARVAEVMVARGDRVAPGEPLLRFYDGSELEIRATVPEHALQRVRLAAAGAGVDARGEVDGERVPLSLSRFSGRADPGQGGVEALFAVTADHTDLVLGRFAALEVLLPPEPESVLLPFEALYDAGRVYRVVDGRMQAVEVARLGQAEMANGERGVLVRAPELESGDRIVSTQIPQAMDGARVQVMEP